MMRAGVNDTCAWAKLIIEKFMEHNWENKRFWKTRDLWDGNLTEYQLGKKAMGYLRYGRNAISIRVKATMSK